MKQGRPQKIVLVVPVFPKLSETFVVSNFMAYRENGWDVHVVCGKKRTPDWKSFPDLERPEIIRRVHASWPHTPRFLQAILFLLVFFRCAIANPGAVCRYLSHGSRKFGFMHALNLLYLDSEFIVLKADLIHFQFGDLAKGRMHLKELLPCRVIVSFRGHDLNFMGQEEPDFYKEIWEQADAFHFMSRDLLKRAQHRGFTGGEYSIITGAVDCDYFDPGAREFAPVAGTTGRPLRILSIGRLSWSKGYEFGLKAVQILIQNGISCEYRIAGDGPFREAVNFIIRDLELENSAKLLSWQPPSAIKAQMQWADVFLHSSISEGFGVVVLEAQAMALPVVSTDADGLRENVKDGETGFVVSRRDPEAIAGKLALLCRDANLRKKMGEAGRQRAQTEFTITKEMKAYDALLRKALKFPLSTAQEHPQNLPHPSDISLIQ
jgi:colanic acid/amylovoran biosynthesis glycosyltransferase